MEALLEKLSAYSRFLELEDSIPYWEAQIPELKAKIRELKANRDSKETDLQRLENPGFFQRLLGRTEEKQKRLNQLLSQSNAAWMAAKWDLEELEKKIAAGKKEREALAESRELYNAVKQETILNAAQESRLIMEEISAFAPLALSLAERTLLPLQDAQLLGVGVTEVKTEMLNQAEKDASRLREVLSVMPEGCADVGGFLQNPNGFLYATAAVFGQQNRLNMAVAQIQTVVNQLRNLLGE